MIVHEDFDKVSTDLNSIFNVSSDSIETSLLECHDDLSCIQLDDVVVSDVNIVEGIDTITLNKESRANSDSDSYDSFTSDSCSSRSSYTNDSHSGSGSDCDIDDIICLDEIDQELDVKKTDKKSKNKLLILFLFHFEN